MIKRVIETINQFRERGGYHIFLSTLVSQITQVILVVFIVRLLSPSEYGELVFIQSYIAFFIPFSGLGLNYSLLRFGSIEDTLESKRSIYLVCYKYGISFSIILYIIISIIGYFFDLEIITNYSYILIFTLLIITNYMKEIAQSYLRINNQNIAFAYSNIIYSIALLIVTVLGTFVGGAYGFIVSRVIVPAFIFMFIAKKEKLFRMNSTNANVSIKEYSNYGIFIGLGSIASQLMYQIDNLLLGVMGISASMIAEYKVATIIPFAVLFIPSVFMTTDFVMIAQKYNDKEFLLEYRNKMMKLLFLISFLGTIISFIFSRSILSSLYGSNYTDSSKLMNILMIGIISSFTLRAPNGNILSAVGKSKWNAILAYSTVGFNVILNYFLISVYGYYGAAIATSIVMWITGIMSYLLFNKYIKEIS